jgi:hypothetical protein
MHYIRSKLFCLNYVDTDIKNYYVYADFQNVHLLVPL